jgi:hypothetical protein
MKLAGKLVVAILCIVAILIVSITAFAQYIGGTPGKGGFGYPGSGYSAFNPLEYFKPVQYGTGNGFPGLGWGIDIYNPFVHIGFQNRLTNSTNFTSTGNKSKGIEQGKNDNQT